MTINNGILKKQLAQWEKIYGTNSKEDQTLWYAVQVSCASLKIDFDEVLKFMDKKTTKFKLTQLDKK